MEIQFYIDDSKTCTLMSDNIPIIDNIPYVPNKLVDLRGAYLWWYLGEQGVMWEEVTFENLSEKDILEIERGFNYCDAGFPEIKKEILKREKQKLRK